jgi:hypothetical protein
MKKALFFIFLFSNLAATSQIFKNEKFTEPVDLIQITTLKKRVLGIENIQVFATIRDSILSKYTAKTIGDESLYYEYYNDKYWPERSYVKFYVYDFLSCGNLDTSFNLQNGIYSFEFYSNGKIIKSFIGTIKGAAIVDRIDTTSKFDYINDYTEN